VVAGSFPDLKSTHLSTLFGLHVHSFSHLNLIGRSPGAFFSRVMEFTHADPNDPLEPPPAGQVSDFSDPVEQQRYNQIIITLAILYSVSTICVLLRLWTRAVLMKHFGWDDGILWFRGAPAVE
jgi:hypothetical protein